MNRIEELLVQIIDSLPEGKVITYGSLAELLGWRRAARYLADCVRRLKLCGFEKWYKVVREDLSVQEGAELPLLMEGIGIRNGRVSRDHLANPHEIDVDVVPVLKRARESQRTLRKLMSLEDALDPDDVELAAGVDVSYVDGCPEVAVASCVVMDRRGEIKEIRTVRTEPTFPYIPTFLAFRELRPCVLAVRKCSFDVLFVDGHGLAHPEKFGDACHLGVVLGAPSIGVAKSLLAGKVIDGRIFLDGDQVGWVLERGKRIFISPGNKIGLESSVRIAEAFIFEGPQPDPLVLAHRESRKEASKIKTEIRSKGRKT